MGVHPLEAALLRSDATAGNKGESSSSSYFSDSPCPHADRAPALLYGQSSVFPHHSDAIRHSHVYPYCLVSTSANIGCVITILAQVMVI